MAPVQQSRCPRQHYHHAAATEIARIEPGRKPLALHAGKLALKPGLQVLRGYRRSLLRCMENARKPALAHHVNRTQRMGQWVLINESAYKRFAIEFTLDHFRQSDHINLEILSEMSLISFRMMNLYVISVNRDNNMCVILYLISLDLQERALCEVVPGILRQIHECSQQGLARRIPLSTILQQSLGSSIHIHNP